MASNTRRRLSFVDFAHPQVWHKLIEYTEVTIAFTKLITDFTNQWAKICFLASSQLHHLVTDFRKKTETEIRSKCHLGGMMYDLWESLLLESELESQSLKKLACLMEKEICNPLGCFITNKNVLLSINKQHRADLDAILKETHQIVEECQADYSTLYHDNGVSPELHRAHNRYLLELTGVNGLLSKYQYHILPQLLQGMEESQIEIIDTVCQNLQLIASLIQNYHEQRHSSLASFVVTSTTTNPNEELENYICSMNESTGGASTPPVHIEFEAFVSPIPKNSTTHPRSSQLSAHSTEQLIVYASPIIQSEISSMSKETVERLKELKKDKTTLIGLISKTPVKAHYHQHDEQQQLEKKFLNQLMDHMKRKHQLRLIELEESVLLAQQDLLKAHRNSMSSLGDGGDPDGQKRNKKNIKGLWREAVKTLKSSNATSNNTDDDDEARSSFVRRFSLRKKKTNQDSEQDETAIDPVYETLRIAAETRKMTLAHYLQQRQQTFNKQTSLNSQGSSELDIQASPRVSRHASRTETEIASSLRPPLPPSPRPPSSGAAPASSSSPSSSLDRARVSNC